VKCEIQIEPERGIDLAPSSGPDGRFSRHPACQNGPLSRLKPEVTSSMVEAPTSASAFIPPAYSRNFSRVDVFHHALPQRRGPRIHRILCIYAQRLSAVFIRKMLLRKDLKLFFPKAVQHFHAQTAAPLLFRARGSKLCSPFRLCLSASDSNKTTVIICDLRGSTLVQGHDGRRRNGPRGASFTD